MNRFSHSILRCLLIAIVSAWFGSQVAHAAVVYSGLQDIAIPTSFAGVYLDLATEGTSTPPSDPDSVTAASFAIGYSEPVSWDVNFFFGGVGIAYSDTFQPFVDDPISAGAQILNVAPGTLIQPAASTRTLSSSPAYGGSGRPEGLTGYESHFDTPGLNDDPAYSAFIPGSFGYIAFVLNPGVNERYGWMSVTLEDDGTEGTIHAWAYSDESTFTVGTIPEPSVLLLLPCGLLVLMRRKR